MGGFLRGGSIHGDGPLSDREDGPGVFSFTLQRGGRTTTQESAFLCPLGEESPKPLLRCPYPLFRILCIICD
jgi:hypothetical protein